MEQVLFRLHVRLLTVTNKFLGYRSRRSLECVTLISSFLSLAALFFLHVTYVTNSSHTHLNCIMNGLDRAGLMGRSVSVNESVDLIALHLLDPDPGLSLLAKLFKPLEEDAQLHPYVFQYDYLPALPANESISRLQILAGGQSPSANLDENALHLLLLPSLAKRPYGDYLFSFHRGVLMLTQEADLHRSFSMVALVIRKDADCLGPVSMKRLLHLVGYDIVIMNWIISAFGGVGHLYNVKTKELFNLNFAADFVAKKGVDMMQSVGRRVRYNSNTVPRHVKGLLTPLMLAFQNTFGEVFWNVLEAVRMIVIEQGQRQSGGGGGGQETKPTGLSFDSPSLHSVLVGRLLQLQQFTAFRLGVVFSTCFLFFVCTTLVSYILRQTQERMLRFTYLLQYQVAHNLPYGSLVVSHLSESLVFVPIMIGIYFFLFEFFSDQLLAFLVLLVVWMGEVFSILSLRSRVSIAYFPRFFLAFFFLFHIYFFCYPFGFAYLALLTHALFVLFTMMHFWNVYEVPVYESGRLTPARPRLSLSAPTEETLAFLHNNSLRGVGMHSSPPGTPQRSRNGSLSGVGVISSLERTRLRTRSGDSPSLPLPLPLPSPLPSSTNGVAVPPVSQHSGGPQKGPVVSRHHVVLSNIYESVEARRLRLQHQHSAAHQRTPATTPSSPPAFSQIPLTSFPLEAEGVEERKAGDDEDDFGLFLEEEQGEEEEEEQSGLRHRHRDAAGSVGLPGRTSG
eukprot:gene5704-6288_t